MTVVKENANKEIYVYKRVGKRMWRNWWLLKHNSNGKDARIQIKAISFPKEWAGKKIRLKVEIE